ncbi:MAG TPA: hypothetical protein VE173_16750, partial [Longimicrobiales bacterium]|nr:hypothetical protein [Longimicrobiales bacterium]
QLYVERCQTLLPSRDRLRRIDELEARAGPEEELDGLPPHPAARLEELDGAVERAERRRTRLQADAEEPRRRVEAFGEAERAVVESARAIRDAVARSAGLEPVRVRTGQLEQELRSLERRTEDTAREVLRAPWEEVDPDAVLSVPAARLRQALDAQRRAREDRRVAEETMRSLEGVGGEGPSPPSWIGVALAALGGFGLAGALVAGRPVLGVPAALLLGVGVALLAVRNLGGRRLSDGGAPREGDRLDRIRAAETEARSRVADLLAALPVREQLLEHPTAELAGSVERLQELVRDRSDRLDELEEHRRELDSAAASASRLAADLDLEVPGNAAVAAHRLEARLREAEATREAASSARRELERLEREMDALSAELGDLEERRDALADRLAGLARPDEDGLWAVRAVEERLEARETAHRLREDLLRDHPDLDELRRRIDRLEASGADWHLDADTLARRRARESELAERIEALARRLEGIDKDMDYLRREETVGAVDGEIEAVRAELATAVRARDRLQVLAAVLREADRRFRAEHQPDVLRKAGCHLATITGGRYERILLDEAGEGRFLLDGPGYPGPVEVGRPISTGTREQIYLALRLAILDHLDRQGERLPLFMDEAFVNWDQARRGRAFGLLEEVARTRQVFVFTCHEAMAGSLAARGARVLVLEGVA